jgi:hypothetical protein
MFVLMNHPVDSQNRLLGRMWNILTRLIRQGEFAGFVLGGCLYPLESLLIRLLQESPTTEIVVCRKPA